MRTEEMKESIEKVHEGIHQAGPGREQWMSAAALTTTLVAVLAAVVGLIGNMATSKSILAKNDAVLSQTKASNLWAFFQAKSIKSNLYEVEAKVYPARARDFSAEIARYDREKDEIRVKAEAAEKETERANRLSEHYYQKHHVISFAETFLQISIALSAIAVLMRRREFWWISMAFALGGIACFIAAFHA